jgi:hypothetical protein
MKRKIMPIALASLFLGIIFDIFFYGQSLGVSFFLFTVLALGTTLYLHLYFRRHVNQSILVLSPVILLFAAMTFIRANGFLNFLNVIMVMYLFALIVQLAFKPTSKLQKYQTKEYINNIATLPFATAKELLAFVPKLLRYRSQEGYRKHNVTPVVRGILLSLPFIFAFLLLFSSADLVFNRFVGSLFDFHISPKLIEHSFLIVFISSIFVGLYALVFMESPVEAAPDVSTDSKKPLLGNIECSIILGSVTLLFAVFVLIQITYLFGGQQNIIAAGFTYAEYARKGFFELMAVAALSLLLILALNTSTIRQSLKDKVVFIWLTSLLIVEVLVIMLSAHKRLSLYEQAYGFTSLRLYSHIFIGWLVVLFVLLLVHIIREEREYQFAFRVFISVIAGLLFVNFINPDAFIARKNIQRFNDTGKIDVFYLRNLSDDATPEISTLLNNSNEQLRKTIAQQLHYRFSMSKLYSDDWQSYSISRKRSQDILQRHSQLLEENKNYQLYPGQFNGQ